VPGARNHPFASNVAAGRFAAPDELRRRLDASQDGVADERTIAMCGSGVTACHLLLAMEVAGKHGARLYPGSWSEWIRDPSRPVARG
jgi:thiosulfate/3-mercaptopyruvate sulfurtransferase